MKRAVMDFSCEFFTGDVDRRCDLSATLDAMVAFGLRIVGSAPSDYDGTYKVRLIVDGDSLPDECADGWRVVRAVFIQEMHGDQRIVRVDRIDVVGQPRLILAA